MGKSSSGYVQSGKNPSAMASSSGNGSTWPEWTDVLRIRLQNKHPENES